MTELREEDTSRGHSLLITMRSSDVRACAASALREARREFSQLGRFVSPAPTIRTLARGSQATLESQEIGPETCVKRNLSARHLETLTARGVCGAQHE